MSGDPPASGVRVTLTAQLAAAHLTFHVDINVGDPIWPAPQPVTVPRLLDGGIRVIGYPLAMVHAEKLVTAIQRGAANTRWRDFVDVYALSRRHDIAGDELTSAIKQVAEHRDARLTSLGEALGDYATLAQPRWASWLRKQRLTEQVPGDFRVLLDAIGEFADPALLGDATGQVWNAAGLTWNQR